MKHIIKANSICLSFAFLNMAHNVFLSDRLATLFQPLGPPSTACPRVPVLPGLGVVWGKGQCSWTMQLCVHREHSSLHSVTPGVAHVRLSLLEGLLHRPFLRLCWESVVLIHVC